MYTVGVFYAWDWLALTGITIAYLLCPKRFIGEGLEYVKFFLYFLSGYFLLFLVIANLSKNEDFTHYLFGICFGLALFGSHCLYPFRKVKRSKHLSFFLFWIGVYFFGLRGVIVILHVLFGNSM